MTVEAFSNLAKRAHRQYRTWAEPKPRGGHRVINAPFGKLKTVQSLLKDEINKISITPEIVGRPKTSTVDAMIPHVRKPVVIAMDLADFFPTVRNAMLIPIFERILDDPKMAQDFVRIATRKNALPQGAPSSPGLARLAIEPAFLDLKKALNAIDPRCHLTLWVDDLTISGPIGIARMQKLVEKVFRRHGFAIQGRKTKVMRRSEEQENLGLKVNHSIEPVQETLDKFRQCVLTHGHNSPKANGYRRYFGAIKKAGASADYAGVGVTSFSHLRPAVRG